MKELQALTAAPYMIYVDVDRCMGCRSCEIACAVEHSMTKQLFTAIMEKPLPKPRITVLHVDGLNVPLRCQHCRNPPCVQVCPTGAMYQTREGFVLVEEAKCIGCGMCSMACPFGHPQVDPETGTVYKCDFCIERLKQGRLPACVEACPTGALVFGTVKEVLRYARGKAAHRFLLARRAAEELLPQVPSPLMGGQTSR